MAKISGPGSLLLARNYNTIQIDGADNNTTAELTVGPYVLQRDIVVGSAVFPLDDVLQLIARGGNVVTTIGLKLDTQQVVSYSAYVINGAGDRDMRSEIARTQPLSWPQPAGIAVFPAFDYNEEVLIDMFTGMNQTAVFTVEETGAQLTLTQSSPLFFLPMSFFRNLPAGDYRLKVAADGSEGFLTVRVDPCATGLFVRWFDAAGLRRYYLWQSTEQTDEASTEDSYRALSPQLKPEWHRTVSASTTYTLHSGLVDEGIFELCSSILFGREVQIYDAARQTWVDARVEDGDVERGRAALQDCIVELTIDHLTL